jgi:CTP:molybdopterin cytidylyltransferase MocA
MSSKPRAQVRVIPIILAAGAAPRLGLPHALAEFPAGTALAIAVENCARAGMGKPIVVVGCAADQVRDSVPHGLRVVVNRRWREGMLSSIRTGLRRVPRDAAVMLYPVDLPLLTAGILQRLARAFTGRRAGELIVSPVHRGRAGHPVILAAELRSELARARTAREVVERDAGRVKLVRVNSAAIYRDFDTPAELRRLQKAFKARDRETDEAGRSKDRPL